MLQCEYPRTMSKDIFMTSFRYTCLKDVFMMFL